MPELIYGGNSEVHMGRHQYDDVPREAIADLVQDEVKAFKHYEDVDDEKPLFTQPQRRVRRQQVSYASAVVVTPPKPSGTPRPSQSHVPKEDHNMLKCLEHVHEQLLTKMNEVLETNKQLSQDNSRLTARIRELEKPSAQVNRTPENSSQTKINNDLIKCRLTKLEQTLEDIQQTETKREQRMEAAVQRIETTMQKQQQEILDMLGRESGTVSSDDSQNIDLFESFQSNDKCEDVDMTDSPDKRVREEDVSPEKTPKIQRNE